MATANSSESGIREGRPPVLPAPVVPTKLSSFLRGFVFFGINLLAILVGNLPWIVQISPPQYITYLYFPVCLLILFLNPKSELEIQRIAVIGVVIIAMISFAFHCYKHRWLIPVGLLILSFIQGGLAIMALAGLIT